MNERRCPHPSCPRYVNVTRFCCAAHWRTLPPKIKREINVAWCELIRPSFDAGGNDDRLRDAQSAAVRWWSTRPAGVS